MTKKYLKYINWSFPLAQKCCPLHKGNNWSKEVQCLAKFKKMPRY